MSTDQILDRLVTLQKAKAQNKLGARGEMLAEAKRLVSSLELPSEFIVRTYWTENYCGILMRVAVDLKIFEALAAARPEPVFTQDLAKRSGAEVALIERIMKHLAACDVVLEHSENNFAANELTVALTHEGYIGAVFINTDLTMRTLLEVPKFLKETSYADPTDILNTPYHMAFNTKIDWFAWITQNPPYLEYFQAYMETVRQGKMSWMEPGFFPVEEKLKPSGSAEEVLFVDVGGGQGQNVSELVKMYPQLSGKVVLQDLPEVVELAKPNLATGVTAMAHNFFEKQPIKGARAYYMHLITHDWDDENCVKIFEQLRPAMTPGKSMLLINEQIVPNKGAGWNVTSFDWCMLTYFASRERTEAHFQRLLEKAGFKIDKIWFVEQGTESIIEASVA